MKYLQIIVSTLFVLEISSFHMEKKVPLGAYNYVVSIWKDRQYLCGGIIFDREHVLTTATCINNIESTELSVIAGAVATNSDDKQILRVNDIYFHYDVELLHFWIEDDLCRQYDIAVLQLQYELVWNSHMQPIPLPPDYWDYSNQAHFQTCEVTGWKLSPGTPNIYNLIWIEIKLQTDEDCKLRNPLENEKCFSIDARHLVMRKTKFKGGPVICNNYVVGMITRGRKNNGRFFLDLFQYSNFIANAIESGKTDVKCGDNHYIVSIWSKGFYKCSGIIVSSTHILTSAHCVLSTEQIDLRVVTGFYQVLPRNRRIEWLLVDNMKIDCISGIAILKVTQLTTCESTPRPAILALPSDFPTNQTCEVFRWHQAYQVYGETLMQLVRTPETILCNQVCGGAGVQLRKDEFCTTGPYSHPIANIENIGSPIVCGGIVFGIMIPTVTSSIVPSPFVTFVKTTAFREYLRAAIRS